MSYVYLISAFTLNALANILLKIGSGNGINLESFNPIFLLKNNIYLVLGFIFFVLNALLYFLALKNIPISLAYPVMATMSLLIIGSAAFLYFGESFTLFHAIGYSLIVLGIIITFMGTN